VKLYFRWILGGMPARLLAIAAKLIATSNSGLSKRSSATMFSAKPHRRPEPFALFDL
jgi:hypothetical protein